MATEPTEPSTYPPVSVVVVTLNGTHLLRACLRSLVAQDYPAVELVVVDNGSEEDIPGMLRAEFPQCHCVRLAHNEGFAGGTNRGIELSKGAYIVLLNNDAAAHPGFLSALVRVAEAHPEAGAVGSVVMDGNTPGTLDSYGVGIALDGMSMPMMRGSPMPATGGPQETLAVSGCACLFRRAAIEQTGLFDENFFAYCEDTDLCLRLQRAGWSVLITPHAIATHYYSRTAGSFSLRKIFWLERNHFWVAVKNFPLFLLPLVPFISLWRVVALLYAALFRRGPARTVLAEGSIFAMAGVILGAQLAALAGIPEMIWRRLTLRPRRRISSLAMARRLFHYRLTTFDIITGSSVRPVANPAPAHSP